MKDRKTKSKHKKKKQKQKKTQQEPSTDGAHIEEPGAEEKAIEDEKKEEDDKQEDKGNKRHKKGKKKLKKKKEDIEAGEDEEPTVEETAPDEKSIPRTSKFILRTYEETPFYLRGNPFIRTGYRVNFSWGLCCTSLCRKHNETYNIWTHLLGFLSFVILAAMTFGYWLHIPATPDYGDYIIFAVFLLCAMGQMLFSALFHQFCCHSSSVYKWGARLDYSGISLMIVGSFYPPLYYSFYCNTIAQWVYLSLITVLGIIGLMISYIPIFASAKCVFIRTGFFVAFGMSAVAPGIHIIAELGIWYAFLLGWKEAIMGALYLGGAVLYAAKIPERWFPGKLDCSLLASHPLWHIIVVLAGWVQMYACIWAYEYRMGPDGRCD